MEFTTELTLIGRMALGTFLGYVIGFEREYRGKPAGERTFGLLAFGSAAVTGVGVLFFPASAEKVIAGVITGVGFLGAGLIFRERQGGQGQVLGLTTAASSWAAAAVGILAGAGAYVAASAVSAPSQANAPSATMARSASRASISRSRNGRQRSRSCGVGRFPGGAQRFTALR